MNSINWPKKISLLVRTFCHIWTLPKFSQKCPSLNVTFDEKHDGHVTEAIRLTVLELCSNFVQKWGPDSAKMVPPYFWRRIFDDFENPHNSRSYKSNEFDKLAQKLLLVRAFWPIWTFSKFSQKCPLCEIRRETRWKRGRASTIRFRVMPKFRSKLEPRFTKNYPKINFQWFSISYIIVSNVL